VRNVLANALCATAMLLTACAGSSQTPLHGLPPTASQAGNRVRPQSVSWMAGGVGSQDLLYVTNGNSEVTVYRYWQHTLIGVLTDFTQPMGECVDRNQNVYITDYVAKRVVEYAHGGKKPIVKFDDSPDSPYSCWIDPTTGNLAVANDDGTSQGSIATFAGSKRTTYMDSTLFNFEGCAYDDKGDLLVTNGSREYPYTSFFAWLPKNGTKLINLTVPGPNPSWTWYAVQGLQWDGKYFTIDFGDAIYRESLMHGQAYYVGATYVVAQGARNVGPYGFYTAPDASHASQVVEGMTYDPSGSDVVYWDYPAGGNSPIAAIGHGLDKPFGVAVSLKRQ
jgi:hypothetical protein